MTPEERFNIIVETQSNGVFGLAYSILKNQADAADITQETFIRLWKFLHDIRDPSAKGWLLRTARNLSLDRLRRCKPSLSLAGSPGGDHAPVEIEDSRPNPAEATELKSLEAQIMEAAEHMPETWKTVFLLKEVQHCSYQEIADISGYPLNSVKVYLLRARQFLQNHFRTLHPETLPSTT